MDKKTKAEITTEKGKIILELYIEDAPGSVSNFVKLAKSGYYNGKNFHRVVPNFVIQGGCNRGDGFGSEDYSIRSELANLRYEEGTVGMASSGKDTESTQWFITHSPTPHLDGSYTVFARVIEGMEVIHTIEIGDKITQVEIK
nr:peptidylprolyl isomerase [Fulvivirga lutea]